MPRIPSISRRPALRPCLAAAGLIAGLAFLGAEPAAAQSATCQEFAKTLAERRAIIEKIQAMTSKKKQLEPKSACSLFGALVTNGNTAVKWLDANKEWCQIPEPFIENIKQDHSRSTDLRGKACKAAAQQAAMEKQAKEGGSGLLGGDGLTGSYRVPQGAL
jgi:hypothetical protein